MSKPAKAPIRNLAEQLSKAGLEDSDGQTSLESILRTGPDGLLEVVRCAKLPPEKRVLVVIDQFEEIFRYQAEGSSPDLAEREEAARFVKLLLAATKDRTVPVYIVLTMRSEYIGDCSSFSGLAEAINAGTYLLPRMSRLQIEDAIVEPLRLFGQTIENKLLQHLLNEVQSAQQDGLPLLQHALRRTWEAWEKAGNYQMPLGMHHFELEQNQPSGLGIADHLNAHLEEIFGSLSPGQQVMAAKIFKLLGEFDHKMRLVRRPTDFSTILAATETTDHNRLLEILDPFRDEKRGRSFLKPGLDQREELLSGAEPVDISHEALLRRWKRCADWIKREARDAEEYRRLADLANRFGEAAPALAGQLGSQKTVLAGLQLEAAVQWLESSRPTAAWAERYSSGGEFDWNRTVEYLQKSLRFRKRRRVLTWASITVGLLILICIPSWIAGVLARKNNALKTSNVTLQAINTKLVETQAQLHANEEVLYREDEKLKKADARLIKQDIWVRRQDALIKEEDATLRAEQAQLQKTYNDLVHQGDQLEQSVLANEANEKIIIENERSASLALEATTRTSLTKALPQPWPSGPHFQPLSGDDLHEVVRIVENYVDKTAKLPQFAVDDLQRAFTRSLAIKYKETSKENSAGQKIPQPVLAVTVRGDENPEVLTFTQTQKISARGKSLVVQKAATSSNKGHSVLGFLGGDIKVDDSEPQLAHNFAITGLGFSTDGEWLATASTAEDIKLWQVIDLNKRGRHAKNLVQGNWSFFVAKTRFLFNIAFHHVKGEYPVEHIALSFDRDGGEKLTTLKRVAAITESGSLLVWSPTPAQRLMRITAGKYARSERPWIYSSIATNPSDQQIWVGTADGTVGYLDDQRNFKPVLFMNTKSAVTALAWAWNDAGTFLAAGDRAGAITIFEQTPEGKIVDLMRLPAHDFPVTAISWSSVGDRLMLASGSQGGAVLLWDLPTQLRQQMRDLNATVKQLTEQMASANDQLTVGDKDHRNALYTRLIELLEDRANRLGNTLHASTTSP